jgi:HlyD family secretion protein
MLHALFNWKLIAGLLFVGVLLAVALRPQTLEVDTARVSRGAVVVTIDEEGETRVRERFVVAAPVAGRLQRIELEPGDPVKRGRVVARLMPASPTLLDARTRAELAAAIEAAQAALGQARAERDRAAAALERATSALKRREGLAAAGVVSKDQLEEDQSAMKTAEEALRAADFAVARQEHELQIARARIDPPAPQGRTITITAPADGVVLKRYRESEADVPAGDALLEIGDPSNLDIVSDLLSTDAVQVSPGNRVLIEQWGGSTPLSGRVRRIEPSGFLKVSALGVEEQRVNVIIDFDDSKDAAARLGDGFRVEVRLVMAEVDNALKTPIGSLFRHAEGWAVFVVENGEARVRSVQPGHRNDLEVEIVTGLAEGETVIVHPPDTLIDGSKVTLRPATPL